MSLISPRHPFSHARSNSSRSLAIIANDQQQNGFLICRISKSSSNSPVMPLRILIVGAGLAGLTTAIGFMRHGHLVTVLERKPMLSEESGSGILLGPNAMRIIEIWGLKIEFEKVA